MPEEEPKRRDPRRIDSDLHELLLLGGTSDETIEKSFKELQHYRKVVENTRKLQEFSLRQKQSVEEDSWNSGSEVDSQEEEEEDQLNHKSLRFYSLVILPSHRESLKIKNEEEEQLARIPLRK